MQISDGYFVTVKDGWNYVHMFYYVLLLRVPHVEPICEDVGFCDGISLRSNKWTHLLELVPAIHEQYPELANEQPIHEDIDGEAAMQLVQLHMLRSDC